MKQYCRYCTNLVTGNGIYCTEKNITMRESTAKSVNHCESFEFNEIDAFWRNKRIQTEKSKINKQFRADKI